MSSDIDKDCERCGKRKYSFWDDPVGDLLSYLCEPRPWVSKVVTIVHNAKTFDSQFILNITFQMKWKPELILNGLKIVSMKIEHMLFIAGFHIYLCRYASYQRHSDLSQPNLGTRTISIKIRM